MFKYFMCFFIFSSLCYGISGLSENSRYIIKYKSSYRSVCASSKRCIADLNMEIVKEIPKDRRNIEYIEPNYLYHAMKLPNDPLYYKQWGHDKINSQPAWNFTTGSKDITVAVIDTGVDYTHEDLKENIWINEAEKNGTEGVDDDGNGYVDDIYGYDFANLDADPIDDEGHGTHCAGVIGAKHNDVGVAGVNDSVKIMSLKFLKKNGTGSTSGAIQAIKYAVDHGVKVISASWGGENYSQALKDVISYAKERGVLFVAAAGNAYQNNDHKPMYPASYKVDNIISVAATNIRDKKTWFSNYGKSVHIGAPGYDILSTVIDNKYQKMNGTSMACPFVSGAAALLLSYENLDYLEVKNRILTTSDYVKDLAEVTATGGRLNIFNMLKDIKPERPEEPEEE